MVSDRGKAAENRKNEANSLALRQAATELGAVFIGLAYRGALPLDTWALPTIQTGPELLTAQQDVYGGDGARKSYYESKGQLYKSAKDLYRDACDTVLPALRNAARDFAIETLTIEEMYLNCLMQELQDKQVEQRLHEAAVRVRNRAGGFYFSEEEAGYEAGSRTMSPATRKEELALERELQGRLVRGRWNRVAQAVGEEKDNLLKILFAHPQGFDIINAYSQEASGGTEFTVKVVNSAIDAIIKFREKLADKDNIDHVWRYPTLVIGGVNRLKLQDVDGFPEFAVEIGAVLGRSTTEVVINHLQMVIMIAGLMLFFMFAAEGAPLVLIPVAGKTSSLVTLAGGTMDLALTGASGGLAYMREREKQLGADASGFRPEGNEFATSSGYEDTILAGAAALVCAIALLGPAKQLLRVKPRSLAQPFAAGKKLYLNQAGHPDTFFPGRTLENQINKSGAMENLTTKAMLEKARGTNKTTLVGNATYISPQKMAANTRKLSAVEAAKLGPGAPREYELDLVRGTSDPVVANPVSEMDFNSVDLEKISAETVPGGSQASSERLLNEADIPSTSQPPPPDLRSLPRATAKSGPIITRQEQLYGIFVRETNPQELVEWAKRELPLGSDDPLIPSIKVTKANPATLEHIVAEELAKQFPDFPLVWKENERRIFDIPENITPLSATVNYSRKSKPYSLYEGPPGHPLSPLMKKQWEIREIKAAEAIQKKIYEVIQEQNQVRGLPGKTIDNSARGIRYPMAPGLLIQQAGKPLEPNEEWPPSRWQQFLKQLWERSKLNSPAASLPSVPNATSHP